MTAPVVLITGAVTGIGLGTALAFAQEGAHLVVSGRREVEGETLVAELRKLGAEAARISMIGDRGIIEPARCALRSHRPRGVGPTRKIGCCELILVRWK
jgi:NAD(P)-dependent dehydrogenase (short-subunit alcohol dehydrogenase family)